MLILLVIQVKKRKFILKKIWLFWKISLEARASVAQKGSVNGYKLTSDDVFLSCGSSGALELAFSVLLNEGDSILLPCKQFF